MNTRSWMVDTLQQSWSFGKMQLPSQVNDAANAADQVWGALGSFVRTMGEVVSSIAGTGGSPWVQTQSLCFYDQLAAGARYLTPKQKPSELNLRR